MTWITVAALAALFKSLASIAEKELLNNETPTEYISGISLIIAVVSLPLFFLVKDIVFSGTDFLLILGLAIVSSVAALLSAYIVKKLDVSESSALFAITPIFVAIFGVVLIQEFLRPFQVSGIILSSLGLFILEFKHKNASGQKVIHEDNRTKLYVVLFIMLIFFALSTIGDRYMIHYRGMDPILFLIVIQLCMSLCMFAYDIVRGLYTKTEKKFIDPKLLTQKFFWANVLFIISHRITHMFGTRMIEASLFNAVKQLNAVFTTIIGGNLFKEKELIRRTFACVVILAGVVLVVI